MVVVVLASFCHEFCGAAQGGHRGRGLSRARVGQDITCLHHFDWHSFLRSRIMSSYMIHVDEIRTVIELGPLDFGITLI